MKVLIVDDEPDVAEIVSLAFKMQWPGCEVISAPDGETALRVFQEERPDVIVLDVGLPGISGFDVCKRLREIADVPIIMLTIMGEEMDRVRGLELGADDYVPKPFSPLELVARTRAVLRRAQMLPMSTPSHLVVDDDLTVELADHRVLVKGKPVKLTPTEFRLLSHLVSNAGQVLPHEALLAKAWGHQSPDDVPMLKVHIARLREKLGDDAHDPRYIFTEWGVGYRFVKPRGTS